MRNRAQRTVLFDPVDLELVRETDLRDFAEYIVARFGGHEAFPPRIYEYITSEAFKSELEPIFDMQQEGDSLWLGRREWGPLLGDDGIALVREGRPIAYVIFIRH